MKKKVSIQKVVILVLVLLLCAGGVSLAAWKIADDGGDEKSSQEAAEGSTYMSDLEITTSSEDPDAALGEEGSEEGEPDYTPEVAAEGHSGEDFSYTSPDQRYVTVTQRHQNFFKAVAEGRVTRMEVTSVDYQPVGDPNTSYVYFVFFTDAGRSSGTFVMKFEGGMWRIAAINQLQGDLEGGTNYMVPASFEDDLAREFQELQPFLTKVAEGRFQYMTVDNYIRPSECEVILTGRVVGKSGRTEPSEMYLRKDYGLWHITNILCL
jgi:hypothetical protein